MEQVIDGSLSSLGDPTYSILAMTMNDKNEFLAAYNGGKIVKFTYDATVPSVPNDKITVYSLSEDDLVKQTISAYQTQYPNLLHSIKSVVSSSVNNFSAVPALTST